MPGMTGIRNRGAHGLGSKGGVAGLERFAPDGLACWERARHLYPGARGVPIPSRAKPYALSGRLTQRPAPVVTTRQFGSRSSSWRTITSRPVIGSSGNSIHVAYLVSKNARPSCRRRSDPHAGTAQAWPHQAQGTAPDLRLVEARGGRRHRQGPPEVLGRVGVNEGGASRAHRLPALRKCDA